MRVGQKNGLVYQWGQKKGSRPAPAKGSALTKMLIFFGAVCPGRKYWKLQSSSWPHGRQPKPCRKHVDEISLAVATRARHAA